MKLGELIELIDEETWVTIKSADTGEEIARYNEKDSIPSGLNPCIVVKIRADYCLEIQI